MIRTPCSTDPRARGSFGRSEVKTAQIEADRFFHDRRDLRHGSGISDLETAPLSWQRAKGMRTGERYRIASERSTLA